MITLITICDLFWLLWALPLLGLLWCWWRSNKKYDDMVGDYEGKVKGLNNRISGMETDLSASAKAKAEIEGDLAITKGRMREMEADMKSLKAEAERERSKLAKDSGGSQGSKESKLHDNSGGDQSMSSSTNGGTSSTEGDVVDGIAGSGDLGSVVSSLAGASGAADEEGTQAVDAGSTAESNSSNGDPKAKSVYGGIKNDNLQIIEGIGPKMESVLKENGVGNFSDLANQTPDSLRAILAKYGDRYTKIIDPTTWGQQAGYAAKGDYDGLIDLQKRLDTGRDNASNMTDSKLEKYLIKTGALKAFKQDDLKAIEGIGPATEKLLHSKGIKTWRELANTNASTLKDILTEAGSRFALGDPTTWPKQAELAADGDFDHLREYQDFLDGGRG